MLCFKILNSQDSSLVTSCLHRKYNWRGRSKLELTEMNDTLSQRHNLWHIDIDLVISLDDFNFLGSGKILGDSVVEIFCKIYYLLTFQFSAGDILRGYIQHIISNKNTTIAAWIPQNLTEKRERKPREEI